MNILNRTIIEECPTKCGTKNMTYKTFVEIHIPKECPNIKVKCKSVGCGKFFLRKQIKYHILNNCSQAYKECDVCKVIIKLNDTTHSCT